MPNSLKTSKLLYVTALLELGWTYRRIKSETGVRRETISRYDRLRRAKTAKVFPGSQESAVAENNEFEGSDPPKPAKVFAGSSLPPRSSAAHFRDAIVSKLYAGLSVQRIWQDQAGEYGFGYSYETVKRFVRKLLCMDCKIRLHFGQQR